MSLPIKDGKIGFRDYETWYRVIGSAEAGAPAKLPLLCLHGGPGFPHDYLEPLAELAESGRRVIFYDQLGGGNSDQPHDPSFWTVDLFLEELANLRRALALQRVHLLGQSWGGMLALEYALWQPAGLASLILADSLASAAQWEEETGRLLQELPEEVQATLKKHEDAGTTGDPAYEEAMMVFYRRHVCRLDPWPEPLMKSVQKKGENPEVYQTMWGPSEFRLTGTLKGWDVSGRLGEIKVPTLVLSGRYDEATPALAETLNQGIAGSEMVIFENSAHMPHLEETERYLEVVGGFLDGVESGGSPTY